MSADQEFLNLAGASPRARLCSMNWQDWCLLNDGRNTTGSLRTLAPSAQTTRCSGYWKQWASSRCSREKRPQRSPQNGSLCGRFWKMLLSKADEVEKRMAGYTSQLESRIAQLPKELQEGLDPPRIAKLLGESLRQCFQQSGLPETARALGQCCSEMNSVQTQLVNVLREVAHPDGGVIAKVRSANDSLLRSMTARAQQIDDLLGRLEKQVWAIWLPVVASAALALGFFLGTWFASERQVTPETPSVPQPQQELAAPDVPPQTLPQRRAKHH